MGFTRFHWVLLGYTEFTGLYWVLLGYTGFYWVILGYTGFYWVLLFFSGILPRTWVSALLLPMLVPSSLSSVGKDDSSLVSASHQPMESSLLCPLSQFASYLKP